MSVNLSAGQINQPGVVELVRSAIADSGLRPHDLQLEITESVLMNDAAAAVDILGMLKDIGVRLSIDDFGTGYSSLSYLKRFPVDVLKIDRSFVDGLGNDPDDSAIAAAIVSLAGAMRLEVIAEGVETDVQRAALLDLGCTHGQGYHFARPMPVTGIEALLDHQSASSVAPADQLAGRVYQPPTPRTAPARVLIVDDDPVVRDLLRLTLDLEGGFTVVAEAGDARHGIDLALLHQPDLVLLDLLMPGMSGLEAIHHFARVAPAAKVVVLTALDRSSIAPDTIAGIDGFFEKTSDLSDVTERLAILVGAGS